MPAQLGARGHMTARMMEVEVASAPTRAGHQGRWQPVVGCFQDLERPLPVVPRIHIQHHDLALSARKDPDVGVRPAVPPLPDPIEVAARLLEAVPRPGVFARTGPAVLSARTL